MAIPDQDENIPFLSPATAPTPDEVADNDEGDYRTLIAVEKILREGIAGLSKDFNSFDLSKEAPIKLEAQVAGRQIAFDLVSPIYEMVKSAINNVEMNRKA